jgi:hypothetical protein
MSAKPGLSLGCLWSLRKQQQTFLYTKVQILNLPCFLHSGSLKYATDPEPTNDPKTKLTNTEKIKKCLNLKKNCEYIGKESCSENAKRFLFSFGSQTETGDWKKLHFKEDTLIKNKIKFSSYIMKFRGIGCKVIYD